MANCEFKKGSVCIANNQRCATIISGVSCPINQYVRGEISYEESSKRAGLIFNVLKSLFQIGKQN